MNTAMICRGWGVLALGIVFLAGSAEGATIGYWRFEGGNVTGDSSGNGLSLTAKNPNAPTGDAPVSYTLPATGAGSAFSDPIPQTGQVNGSAIQGAGAGQAFQLYYAHADSSKFTITSGITVEAYVNSTSTAVTQIIAADGGSGNDGAWAFVVKGGGSLLFQDASGTGAWGQAGTGFETITSGFTLVAGHDYYVAFAMNLADTSVSGVTFYLQDLTAGTALQSETFAHLNTSIHDAASAVDFSIGNKNGGGTGAWNGTLDEVRLSDTMLGQNQLLIAAPEPATWALLALAALGAAWMEKRRRAGTLAA